MGTVAATMSTSIRDRAVALLGQNIQQSLVAAAIGVTDGYISQLLQEPEVLLEIAKAKAAGLESAIAKDATIESLEKDALGVIKAKLTWTKSALEAARIFQILNNAKKATQDAPGDGTAGMQIVQINLPAAARTSIQIQLNSNNQVIEVQGRSMAPLPSRSLPGLAQDMAIKTAQQLLPSPAPLVTLAQLRDKEVAAAKLMNLPDIATFLDGVPCVL